jgi:hypothetical protein
MKHRSCNNAHRLKSEYFNYIPVWRKNWKIVIMIPKIIRFYFFKLYFCLHGLLKSLINQIDLSAQNNILFHIFQEETIAIFADDTIVIASDINQAITSSKLQTHSLAIQIWLIKSRLKVNESKFTRHVHHTKRNMSPGLRLISHKLKMLNT